MTPAERAAELASIAGAIIIRVRTRSELCDACRALPGARCTSASLGGAEVDWTHARA